jgi:hypothetical protein
VKKYLLFGFSLLIAEILIVVFLMVFFLWVERDFCAPYFRASGHCYADWFALFESVFYCFSAFLMSSAIVLLWRHYLNH